MEKGSVGAGWVKKVKGYDVDFVMSREDERGLYCV
jgi:hypothetical protein